MILLIDAGNTRTKWAWLSSPEAVQASENQVLFETAAPLQRALRQATAIWVSNVAGQHWQDWFDSLAKTGIVHWVCPTVSAFGVHNGYQTPAQLGCDRWCSVIAAWRHCHGDVLVVTAGTALTMEAVVAQADGTARFVGGSIQPGLQLMWRSLQNEAAQLQYAPPQEAIAVAQRAPFASDSPHAMWQGCCLAMSGAIALADERFSQYYGVLPRIVLSGGDAAVLYDWLPAPLAARTLRLEQLVLSGLAAFAISSESTL